MANKKHLSDLLREEAQKSPSDAEAIQEAASEPLESDPTLSKSEPNHEATNQPSSNTATPAKRIPTKAELERTVSDLREALDESRGKESSLQQQIADLKSDLQEQKTLLQKLLADLEPTNQIKAELEEAKKVILQLLEDSAKTTQKVNTPKKEKEISRSQKLDLKKASPISGQPNPQSSETFEQNVGWFD